MDSEHIHTRWLFTSCSKKQICTVQIKKYNIDFNMDKNIKCIVSNDNGRVKDSLAYFLGWWMTGFGAWAEWASRVGNCFSWYDWIASTGWSETFWIGTPETTVDDLGGLIETLNTLFFSISGTSPSLWWLDPLCWVILMAPAFCAGGCPALHSFSSLVDMFW